MSATPRRAADARWLLDDLIDRTAGLECAVVLSADGLLVAGSSGLAEDDAEHLAAVASAFQGLARGTARHFDAGRVRQTVVEMDAAFLFITAAFQDACMAALMGADADIGLVAYEVNLLAGKVGMHFVAPPRHGSRDVGTVHP